MKAFITKYALTTGIQEVDDAEISEHSASMVSVPSLGVQAYFHGEGRDWHRTLESAKSRAEEIRVKQIASLKRKIAKLEAMKF